jgi:small subunit ribosomal protein S16
MNMVRVRLARIGGKKNAIYRVMVADQRAPRDGRFLESIGRYDPNQDPPVIDIDKARYDYWVGQGAQPTATVRQLVSKIETA